MTLFIANFEKLARAIEGEREKEGTRDSSKQIGKIN